MQLNRFTDYALRTLIYLGANDARLCTIAQIADAYGVSANHLMKVVNRLASRGYVETVRGKGGGMRLARPPQMINVGEVVRDMEEQFNIVECFDPGRRDCPLLPACALRAVLGEAQRSFMAALDRHSLQDVMAGSGPALARVRVVPIARRRAG